MWSWRLTVFVIACVLAIAGAGLAQWVTGGRSPFGGWTLGAKARRKRRALIERRFPVIGRWLLPAGYVAAVVSGAVMAWVLFTLPG